MTEAENSSEDGDAGLRQASSSMMRLFFIVLGVNILGLIWLAVRSNFIGKSGGPTEVGVALDILFQLAVGISVAAFAFRALTSYPYLTSDLFGMVMVLAAWAKYTVDSVRSFAASGFLPDRGGTHLGVVVQFFLLSASILVSGAALGLWACQRLKLERPLARLIVILPAMVSLPAAAGCAAFLVLAIGEFGEKDRSMNRAFVWMLLWFGSLVLTILNSIHFIRAVALRAEVREAA